MPDDNSRQDRTYWHDAFFEALQWELHSYKDFLTFESEHPLSKQALKMDALVIKKVEDIRIEKNIGRIFKGNNVFEFKSETDSLTTWDYNKTLAYGLLYSAFMQIHVSDITVSCVVTKYPRDLFKHLQNERGLEVSEVEPGIYYVQGELMPVQILETKRLSPEENLFLRNLRSDLNTADMERTLAEFEKRGVLDDRNIYLSRIIEANPDVYEEVLRVNETMERIALRVFEEKGILGNIKNQGKQEGRQEGRQDMAIELATKMLLDMEPIEKIVKWTGLSLETVKTLQLQSVH